MKPTTSIQAIGRWYPLLLLRDARGRFARLRLPVSKPRRRVRRITAPKATPIGTQLALF